MMIYLRVALCCLCAAFMLTACQGLGEAGPIGSPASPLAGESPLALPLAQPLPDDYERPPQPYLLFSSAREGGTGFYLLDLGSEEVMPAPLQNIPAGTRVGGMSWEPALRLFVMQLVDEQNKADLYLFDFAGNQVARVTFDPDDAGSIDYSPANGLFVYICRRVDLDVCITAPNDPHVINLTPSHTREAKPTWSADGTSLLFSSDARGISNIWLMNADGTNRQNLSAVGLGQNLYEEWDASWSPDEQTIVFVSRVGGAPDVYLMDADGTNRRNLSEHPAADVSPRWSPDGRFVIFRSERDEGQDLYVVEIATAQLVNVTNSPVTRENNYIWSSDSERIYFDRETDGVYDIFVVNRDGTGERNLTNNPGYDVAPQLVE